MSYDTVVFDNDGVLTELTPHDVIRDAVRETFREFDVDPSPDAVEALVGDDADGIYRVSDEHDIDPELLWSRREENAARAQQEAIDAGIKGVYEDVDALREFDATRGVVSNNQHATIEYIVETFDLRDLFSVAIGRKPTLDGFRNRKPNPHYLERALSTIEANSALYVGDSNVDVVAARRAGIDVAFLRREHRNGYELQTEPTYEIESLAELPALV
ncbi:HAD superfamily hydrolase [Halalkaliarchaeum desulfuricum]|uniref:HAD superfamily hydrolase n=1 Tax=Halalkaliarchaeum desulfuricum TaxID=2055893 RepID=A0A343TP66_9EURY|nr:HAD family hydrolase [Halalkaliarchaeum desulfuricum]AUX10888.1 HAD superfamily hydrolase [Halalkaliarchaeum desulfuricum]